MIVRGNALSGNCPFEQISIQEKGFRVNDFRADGLGQMFHQINQAENNEIACVTKADKGNTVVFWLISEYNEKVTNFMKDNSVINLRSTCNRPESSLNHEPFSSNSLQSSKTA